MQHTRDRSKHRQQLIKAAEGSLRNFEVRLPRDGTRPADLQCRVAAALVKFARSIDRSLAHRSSCTSCSRCLASEMRRQLRRTRTRSLHRPSTSQRNRQARAEAKSPSYHAARSACPRSLLSCRSDPLMPERTPTINLWHSPSLDGAAARRQPARQGRWQRGRKRCPRRDAIRAATLAERAALAVRQATLRKPSQ